MVKYLQVSYRYLIYWIKEKVKWETLFLTYHNRRYKPKEVIFVFDLWIKGISIQDLNGWPLPQHTLGHYQIPNGFLPHTHADTSLGFRMDCSPFKRSINHKFIKTPEFLNLGEGFSDLDNGSVFLKYLFYKIHLVVSR